MTDTFIFSSPVKGAAANELPGQIPEAVKEQRLARFMAHQTEISSARLRQRIGRIETVLVDEVVEEGAVARSKADAPEIDGQVYITDGQQLSAGDLVNVTIDAADQYDLSGKLCA